MHAVGLCRLLKLSGLRPAECWQVSARGTQGGEFGHLETRNPFPAHE
jgi:hypothetical protein